MSSLQEIEAAIRGLSTEQLAVFRAWFVDFDASVWDRQFQEDVAAGRLDTLADEAISDLEGRRCTDR